MGLGFEGLKGDKGHKGEVGPPGMSDIHIPLTSSSEVAGLPGEKGNPGEKVNDQI